MTANETGVGPTQFRTDQRDRPVGVDLRAGRTWTEAEIRAHGVRMSGVVACNIIYGAGTTKAYEMLQAGDLPFPVLRKGRQYIVPTASVLQVLGLSEQSNTPADVDERALRSVSGRGDAA